MLQIQLHKRPHPMLLAILLHYSRINARCMCAHSLKSERRGNNLTAWERLASVPTLFVTMPTAHYSRAWLNQRTDWQWGGGGSWEHTDQQIPIFTGIRMGRRHKWCLRKPKYIIIIYNDIESQAMGLCSNHFKCFANERISGYRIGTEPEHVIANEHQRITKLNRIHGYNIIEIEHRHLKYVQLERMRYCCA